MISASTQSCYSTLSSRILITNHLITFLTLHSRYSVLQSINTYYSLIRAVYVFTICALFCPCIASPLLYRNYLHVFPISCDCLAPPHFSCSFPSVFIVHTICNSLQDLYCVLHVIFMPSSWDSVWFWDFKYQ